MNGGVPGADIKFEDGLWCVRACQSLRVRLRLVLVARAFLRVEDVLSGVSPFTLSDASVSGVVSLHALVYIARRWDVALLI